MIHREFPFRSCKPAGNALAVRGKSIAFTDKTAHLWQGCFSAKQRRAGFEDGSDNEAAICLWVNTHTDRPPLGSGEVARGFFGCPFLPVRRDKQYSPGRFCK